MERVLRVWLSEQAAIILKADLTNYTDSGTAGDYFSRHNSL
jgi:hypothetical protein